MELLGRILVEKLSLRRCGIQRCSLLDALADPKISVAGCSGLRGGSDTHGFTSALDSQCLVTLLFSAVGVVLRCHYDAVGWRF